MRQRKQSQLKDDLNTDVSQVSNVEGAYVSPFFLCVNLFNGFCSSRLEMRRYNLSCLYQNAINEKYMRTDYANTDNPEANLKSECYERRLLRPMLA